MIVKGDSNPQMGFLPDGAFVYDFRFDETHENELFSELATLTLPVFWAISALNRNFYLFSFNPGALFGKQFFF